MWSPAHGLPHALSCSPKKGFPSEGDKKAGQEEAEGTFGGPHWDPGYDPSLGLPIRGAGNQIKSGFCQLRFHYGVDHREMSAHPGHFLPVGSLLREASGVGSGRFFSSVPTPKRLAFCPGSSCPSPGLQEVDSEAL